MSNVSYAENFVENVRAAMQKREWTQRRLAEEAGVHWQTVHRILHGGMTPTLDTCEKISTALQLRPDKILKNSG